MVWTIVWPACVVKARDLVRISVYGSENTKKPVAKKMKVEIVFSI